MHARVCVCACMLVCMCVCACNACMCESSLFQRQFCFVDQIERASEAVLYTTYAYITYMYVRMISNIHNCLSLKLSILLVSGALFPITADSSESLLQCVVRRRKERVEEGREDGEEEGEGREEEVEGEEGDGNRRLRYFLKVMRLFEQVPSPLSVVSVAEMAVQDMDMKDPLCVSVLEPYHSCMYAHTYVCTCISLTPSVGSAIVWRLVQIYVLLWVYLLGANYGFGPSIHFFCCANLGSSVCAIILGSCTQTLDLDHLQILLCKPWIPSGTQPTILCAL